MKKIVFGVILSSVLWYGLSYAGFIDWMQRDKQITQLKDQISIGNKQIELLTKILDVEIQPLNK